MKAKAIDGRPWFDTRFESETDEWIVTMAIEKLPIAQLSLLQTIVVLALARYMAWKDGEVNTF